MGTVNLLYPMGFGKRMAGFLISNAEKIRKWGWIGIAIGVILVMIGNTGVFLPVLPGVPFLIFGLLILGFEVAFLKRMEKAFFEKAKKPKPKNHDNN